MKTNFFVLVTSFLSLLYKKNLVKKLTIKNTIENMSTKTNLKKETKATKLELKQQTNTTNTSKKVQG